MGIAALLLLLLKMHTVADAHASVTDNVFQVSSNWAYGKCLDLPGGKGDNGNLLWIWDCNGHTNQQWILRTGTWKIQSAQHPDKCLDAFQSSEGTRLGIWDCNGHASQKWGYDSNMQTIYLASSVNSTADASLCMDLKGGAKNNGAAIDLWGCNGHTNQAWYLRGGPSPGPSPGPGPSPPSGPWKSSTLTSFESWPRCCKGSPNYDPSAPKDECTDDSGCKYQGEFAYHQCGSLDWVKSNDSGRCSLDWVKSNDIVAFFSVSGEHKKYKNKKIRISFRGKTIDALVADTCGDGDCGGCCTHNAKKSKDGFLIDMEYYTVLRYFPNIKEPAENLFEKDISWQPIESEVDMVV